MGFREPAAPTGCARRVHKTSVGGKARRPARRKMAKLEVTRLYGYLRLRGSTRISGDLHAVPREALSADSVVHQLWNLSADFHSSWYQEWGPGRRAATNTNVDIADAIYLFSALFLGGPPPVERFPECGVGTEADATLGA